MEPVVHWHVGSWSAAGQGGACKGGAGALCAWGRGDQRAGRVTGREQVVAALLSAFAR